MAFDQPTRNRLNRFVSDARSLLTVEFTRQMQNNYGLDPESGTVTPLEDLSSLDDTRLTTARILRQTLEHYKSNNPTAKSKTLLERIVREQAFTILNRLVALRMAEARGILFESISKGYQSSGFQLYENLAGSGLGEKHEAYKVYLFSIFDEFALDLAVLFDRFSPSGRLFPGKKALDDLLNLLNDEEIESLWAEDETIGWIYQYFNSVDERKKMRKESSAPRNSRELAVRNQFFTPRYVVEFLTDNTLGRTWYEMTGGETSLVENCRYLVRRPNEVFLEKGENMPEQSNDADENLSQEELLKQTVYIPHRQLKDPREILMLDPACGSMHFGLYAFDLYLTIYEEAWELEGRNPTVMEGVKTSQFKSLHETYDNDKERFLQDVPRLIIEYNIHGVDIDPRAVQIAGLSLWLRAQRAWSEQNIKPAMRPQIRRSNIVCAEPMPGEADLLEEFISKHFSETPEKRLLGEFVRRIFDSMQLAGEAGSLLKIEEEVADLIKESQEQWRKLQDNKKGFLFEGARTNVQQGFDFEVGDITDENFWDRVEDEIYKALRRYAETGEDGTGFGRRLFADDAAQGFAFIDLCRKRYDAVLMNPPFGDSTAKTLQLIKTKYPESARNLYVAFHSRAYSILVKNGFAGIICSRTFVTYRNFEKFREILLNSSLITCFADLGWEVLDGANVETACFITGKTLSTSNNFGPFFRLLNISVERKENELLDAIHWTNESITFFANKSDLEVLPGSPLCYWSSSNFINVIANSSTLYPSHAFVGLGASPHAFFFRAWWEVEPKAYQFRWKRISRGGDFSPFYRSNALLIDWLDNGATVKEYILKKYPYLNGNYGWKIQDEDKYEIAGFTWGKRNERFNMQVMPEGHIFTDEGQGVIPLEGENLNFLLGYMNSSLVAYFLSLTSGLQKHYVYIRPVPVMQPSYETQRIVEEATAEIVKIKQQWDTISEISSLYYLPFSSSTIHFSSINKIKRKIKDNWNNDKQKIATLRAKIDNKILDATSLSSEDISEIQELTDTFPTDLPNTDIFQYIEEEKDFLLTTALVSYLIGSTFGRWDIHFATGEKDAPELPDPFAPLPVCPPGMLQNAEGLPAEAKDVSADYPLNIVWNGILVDDAGHPADIETKVREVLRVIWKDKAEEIETEACGILGVKSLRDYFRKPSGFFADHLKRYSKSRRQAPIYLPLSTKSGDYTLWLYYHRLNDQTLYTCVNDYVEPKMVEVKDELTNLRVKTSRNNEDEKRLEYLDNFESELQEFRDELLRLAQLPWKPNLNDGVQITMAPLWNLFGLSKWRKTLEATWKKLEKGDYDWAHLAYSLYPERVREKCIKDKSLAIAHDLEDLYVEPPPKKGKKKRTKKKAEPGLLEDQ
ncbi:MAG: BREX-1 system adenine-specific DNA-methyltransferase PglX [Aridibacter sp.]